ncbi:MAG TPA: lipoyl(octanoyl) transferase LipB [Candidatus Limnocylindria bacterium]|jgi:lipoate-protein ligase B|nr:lipoyl(octanoyl) transferase LipB [Candidatus Limnocylindria bacterium]
MTSRARLFDLGRRRYAPVLELQHALHAAVAEERAPETWLVVEHEPVVTLGRNAKQSNILLPRRLLEERGVDVVEIERGGDVTYHGPGQVVVYPIRKLARFREVVPVVNAIEHAVIEALRQFGIAAHRRDEHRGVYVGEDAICAVGLAVRRMTSMHGLALNACTALDYDRLITPCGTPEFGITSISAQLGRDVSWSEARDVLLDSLGGAFGVEFDRHVVPPGAPLPFPSNAVPEPA